jgi:hypothetical protein
MEEEKTCTIDGCDDPVSECMIPEHPEYCGEHLEQWFLDMCDRVEQEQMYRDGHPDPVGV